nr:immunoglobulin heavy chain junction region [Macaca mulatta]
CVKGIPTALAQCGDSDCSSGDYW